MLRSFFGKTNTTRMLGRWQIADNRSEIRAALANIDSCGDSLCGDPKIMKTVIDDLEVKIKKYETQQKEQKKIEDEKKLFIHKLNQKLNYVN